MNAANKNTKSTYDLIIVGGGLVGASLAMALKSSGLRIAVIEAHAFDSAQQPSFDSRTVALAYTSKEVFTALGLWDAMQQAGVGAIKHIHISDRGHLGQAKLHASDMQTDALGYVVENRVIGKVLLDAIADNPAVDYLCPLQVESFNVENDRIDVICSNKGIMQTLSAKLLVAADGGHSAIRDQAAVKTRSRDYAQCALVANVEFSKPHQNIAYERFTESGPLALLPLPDSVSNKAFSLVWTLPYAKTETYMQLSDAELLQRLQQQVGKRVQQAAGQLVTIGARSMYPLSLVRAVEHVTDRIAFIGNAAHTLHPVAGQGFNLGLRDVAALAEVLTQAKNSDQDIGNREVLHDYSNWRGRDHKQTIFITDTLVRVFSNNLLPFAAARNMSLLLLDTLPRAKYKLTRQAMGYIGKVSRLARGIAL